MEFSITFEELRKRSLFIAIPMYGGMCHGILARSLVELSAMAATRGVQVQYYYLFNESLITRARNYCVDEFLRSSCTHMMFIDSDISFSAHDVLSLLALQNPDPTIDNYDIICGPYPKKCIAWEKIKTAVDHGKADKDPEALGKYVGDYVFNAVSGSSSMPLTEPAEVMESGTGFMMIRRTTFERYDKEFPEYNYKPDHARTEHFDGSREIMAYFDTVIDSKDFNLRRDLRKWLKERDDISKEELQAFIDDPAKYSKRYLSEDYMFCQNVRKAGMHIWLCPWMKLQHAGFFIFGGSVEDLASIGASATADTKKIGKRKTRTT